MFSRDGFTQASDGQPLKLQSTVPETAKSRHLRIFAYLGVAILSSAGLIGKMRLLAGISSLPYVLLISLAVLGLFLPLLWPLAIRKRLFLSPLVIAGLFATLLHEKRKK